MDFKNNHVVWFLKIAMMQMQGPLKDAVEILRTEIVDGGLLQDCLELGSSDLKGVIQILKDVAVQYSSTSHKNELWLSIQTSV